MAQRSRTSSPISNLDQFPTDNASVESAWREALAFRDLGNNARVKSQKRLAQAQAVRAEAESDAITSTKNYCFNARAEADDTLMDQTRIGAEELANRMRSDSSEDIRKILTDIEVARASAEDELETQRLLTETARVRAFSAGLNAQSSREVTEAPVEFTAVPVKKPSAAKKRSSKSTSARKAA